MGKQREGLKTQDGRKMMKKTILIATAAALIGGFSGNAAAGFLTISNPGNLADTRVMSDGTTGYGAVGHTYQIMRYAVTNAQWNDFVQRAGAPTGADSGYSYGSTYTEDALPVQNVSWYEAAQYCNWLTSGDKYSGAYLFDQDGRFAGIDREQAVLDYGKVYALPTEDEWYKAAYYDAQNDTYHLYANGSDNPPAAGVDAMYGQTWPYDGPWNITDGTQEQNGTYNMMGNVWEWNETAVGSYRVLRGGAFDTQDDFVLSSAYRHYIAVPHGEFSSAGFRVVVLVPEPTGLALLLTGGLVVFRTKAKRHTPVSGSPSPRTPGRV